MFQMVKPDGKYVFYDADDSGAPAISISGAMITVRLLAAALSVAGRTKAQIVLYTEKDTLTSFSFIMEIQASTVPDGVTSESYINILGDFLENIEDSVDTAVASATAAAASAIEAKEAAATSAQGAAVRYDTAQTLNDAQRTQALKNLGVSASSAELSFMAGVTGGVQEQLDGKLDMTTRGKDLVSGDDLNNFTTPGKYVSMNSYISAGLLNVPFTEAGFDLYVMKDYTQNGIIQIIISMGLRFWMRQSDNNGVWTPWYQYLNTATVTNNVVQGNANPVSSGGVYDALSIKQLAEDDDLNNITATGTYVSFGGSIAEQILNNPFAEAGTSTGILLKVYAPYATTIYQELHGIYSGGIYKRRYANNAWTTWSYIPTDSESDTVPVAGSAKLITSGGVYDALAGKMSSAKTDRTSQITEISSVITDNGTTLKTMGEIVELNVKAVTAQELPGPNLTNLFRLPEGCRPAEYKYFALMQRSGAANIAIGADGYVQSYAAASGADLYGTVIFVNGL